MTWKAMASLTGKYRTGITARPILKINRKEKECFNYRNNRGNKAGGNMSREDRIRIEQILEEILYEMLKENQEFLAIPTKCS